MTRDPVTKLQDYRPPPHLMRRLVVGVGLSQALIVICVRPLYWLWPSVLAVLAQFALGAVTGWYAGRWAFRSPLTFRESIILIGRLYRQG